MELNMIMNIRHPALSEMSIILWNLFAETQMIEEMTEIEVSFIRAVIPINKVPSANNAYTTHNADGV